MSNFDEDYFEIAPDVDLDQASHVVVLGLGLLFFKLIFIEGILEYSYFPMLC